MTMILTWTKGNTRTYTKNLDLAEVALKNGFIVRISKIDSFGTRIY